MSRTGVLFRNIASNWAGFAINAVITLLLTPIILRELGVARYGVWVLASSVIGYYGLLDMGFRAGVTQYLTRYLAARDFIKASECLSTAVAVLALLGAVLVALSVVTAGIAPRIFTFPPQTEHEAFWCILIVGFTSAVQFAFMPFTSVFVATQRFDLANLIGVATRLLTAVAILAALKWEYGLIGVSVAACGANLIDYGIRWRVSRRLAPDIGISRRLVKLSRLREIGSFGAWNFLISVNSYVYTHVPNILIGLFMPLAAIGQYALATSLSRHVNSVLSPIGQVMYPVATELHAQDNVQGIEKLYHDGSRLMMLVMIPTVLIAMFWAEDFYRIWIGERYLNGPFHSVALLFRILLVASITSYVSSIGQLILQGTGRIRTVAVALISGSLLNVSLGVILIQSYGLVGFAVAVVVASVVIDIIVIPLLLKRALHFSVLNFVQKACIRPLVVGVLQAVLMVFIRMTGAPGGWADLVAQGTGAAVGSAIIALALGVTRDERSRFMRYPLRRGWPRKKAA